MGIFDAIGNFFGNIMQGFLAANEVRKIVFSDPQLFIYPVLALIVAVILFLLISVGVVFLSLGSLAFATASAGANTGVHVGFLTLAIGIFIAFVVAFYVVIYFTSAMLIAFKQYVHGKRITIGQALSATNAYATLLLEWAIFYMIIATILQIIEIMIQSALRRYGIVGNIISSLIVNVANVSLWLATMFALPVILDEKTGPIATIKKSASFIIHNFGNTFGGLIYSDIVQYIIAAVGVLSIFLGGLAILSTVSLSLSSITLFTVVFLFIILIVMFALALSPVGSVILLIGVLIAYAVAPAHVSLLAVFLIFAGIFIIWIGHLVQYVLFNVFRLVIYEYKTTGYLPKGFNKSVIDNNIKRKAAPQGQSSSSGGGSKGGSDPFA